MAFLGELIATFLSSIAICPESKESRPYSALIISVLPAPINPATPNTSLGNTSNEMDSNFPFFVKFFTERMGFESLFRFSIFGKKSSISLPTIKLIS